MQSMKIVAIPTEVAREVRLTMRAPKYGFPAHKELATDAAPCRHCLRTFEAGKDYGILFTYDRFSGVESFPQPGPVYVHADSCPRYPEDSGFPEELRRNPRTIEAYGRGRQLLGQAHVNDGKPEEAIQNFFARSDVEYLQVHSTTAGCFTFRIERGEPKTAASQ